MDNLQHRWRLRPIDLAREHGLSTQAIRNYEAAGILPPAERTPHGYRTYTTVHVHSVRAFLALIPGHGHQRSTSIMRAVNLDAIDEALQLIDESHVQLLDDRRTLRAVENALAGLGTSAVEAAKATSGAMFIGPLAHRLGITAATLRKWENAGLVQPDRDPQTGYRIYSEVDVRDALLTRQLRRGGYPLDRIAPFLAEIRTAGGLDPLEALLGEWRDRLSYRGCSLLAGAAELDRYMRVREGSP
ncbi:TioE family transcriptional regulator [Rhodococcus sovatensis]|uniref:TioE family transcriptional regulator n=1 Tax=Rhodococcus sovatensis TaxID=1805840 RepID=A0ABZ2PF75_9NOCA